MVASRRLYLRVYWVTPVIHNLHGKSRSSPDTPRLEVSSRLTMYYLSDRCYPFEFFNLIYFSYMFILIFCIIVKLYSVLYILYVCYIIHYHTYISIYIISLSVVSSFRIYVGIRSLSISVSYLLFFTLDLDL